MVRRPHTLGFWRGRLPHWEVEEGRYFVTIHLAGAIPLSGSERLRAMSIELSRNASAKTVGADLQLSRTIFREMEQWLDRSETNRLLQCPEIAAMTVEAIRHRVQTQQWIVYQFVIMPNHIHLFLSVAKSTLKTTIEDFKRWTGHQAGRLVELPGGRFWQDEWFDHWSRSDEQDDRIIQYIIDNPRKAGLVKNARDWKYAGTFM